MSGEGSLFDVPPAAIGRFRVLHQVGAGTSGPVFRAVHPETAAPLAIKLFTLDLAPDRASAVAADLEALVARLPPTDGLCELIDAGVHGGAPFLVTTFAPGDSLDVALKQFGPAALIDLVPRLRTLARALDVSAARDVLHGAVHPRDVLVSESSTLVTGLGAWPILVRHGERLPIRRPYRAPELADSATTAAGDRFALAALAYEWMTGRRAPSAFVARDLAPLPGVDSDALGRVLARALHADPGERYSSNVAFVDDLDQVETEAPAFVPEPAKPNESVRRRSRPPGETPSGRLPIDVSAPDESVEITPAAPVADFDRRDDERPIPILHPPPPSEAARVDLDLTLRRHESPAPPSPVVAPSRPAPDPMPIAPVTGRLLQEAHDEPLATRRPGTSGRWRLVAGLLLGATLGIGAGYVAWGRNEVSRSASLPEEGGAANLPAPAPQPSGAAASEPGPTATSTPPSSGAAPESAAPPAPVPATANPPEGGNLLVRSTPPGAAVFVDDRRRGVTPLTLQNVELGTRRIRIVRDGFAPEDRQITLTRSRPSRSVEVRLTRAAPVPRSAPGGTAAPGGVPAARTGSLLIESRPTGATIVLNGRVIGTTPMTIDDLEPGSYTVQLELATFRPITTTVRVVGGARARAAASLVSAQEPE